MKNKWFDEAFLPSLFEKANNNSEKRINLTAKQMAICGQYMEPRTGTRQTSFGNIRPFTYYVYTWHGREVNTTGAWANGCAQMKFGLDAEERAVLQSEREQEQEQKERDHLERMAKHADRWLPKLKERLSFMEEALQDDLEDGEEEKIIRRDKAEIATLMREINYIEGHRA